VTDPGLRRHYEQKYRDDEGPPPTVVRTDRPRDRFEAAVRTLSDVLPRGARVLELAAGDGRVGLALLRERRDLVGYALTDVAETRVGRLGSLRAIDPRITVRHCDAEQPELDPGSVDAIVMIALVEHLVDPIRALRRIRECLAPGGTCYLDTPNIAKWTRRVKLGFGRFPSTASVGEGLVSYEGGPVDLHDEGHLHYFTFGSLERLLQDSCGFTRVDCVPYADGDRLPVGVATRLAALRPGLFSEVALFAHR
jgi:SAM-dependent methyltransferase